MGPCGSVTTTVTASEFNSTARSSSSTHSQNKSHADSQSRSQSRSNGYTKGATAGQTISDSQGETAGISWAEQQSTSLALGESQGSSKRHVNVDALSAAVNHFFTRDTCPFPRAVLTQDVRLCHLPCTEAPSHVIPASLLGRDFYGVVAAELTVTTDEGTLACTTTQQKLLDWQYPVGNLIKEARRDVPTLSFDIKLNNTSPEVRVLDIAFTIGMISGGPEDGVTYSIFIHCGSKPARLTTENGDRSFHLHAYSHSRNIVRVRAENDKLSDVLAGNVRKIEVIFAKDVILDAVQVLVCETEGGPSNGLRPILEDVSC